jgi:hypothetical protein
MMKQYNLLQAIYMSFYSRKLYQDVAMNWGGKSFLYLLLILALSWIVSVCQIQQHLTVGFNQLTNEIVTQIPVLTINKGILSTPENHPYIITDPDSHENIAIIDTSGKYTNLQQVKTGILITKTEIISQSHPNESKIDKIPKELTITLVPQTIHHYLQSYIGYSWIFLFIILVLASYVYRIIQALLYAVIGKIFSIIANVPITYFQVIQITMVAVTPVIIIASVIDALDIKIQHNMLLCFTLAILYMFYGIIVNKKN